MFPHLQPLKLKEGGWDMVADYLLWAQESDPVQDVHGAEEFKEGLAREYMRYKRAQEKDILDELDF